MSVLRYQTFVESGDTAIYEQFYGLTDRPFKILPDPEYLYWTDMHSMAFAVLEYGVMSKSGITVITGDIGSGKTTLIRHLLNQLPDDVTVGLLSNIHKNTNDILSWVMMSLGLEFEGLSKVGMFKQFQEHLIDQYFKNRRTILIIDEAQNLTEDELEELRLLSNINADKEDILQLILVGQPQLKNLLTKPTLEQFAQRVSTDYNLCPLNIQEVRSYITHRLKIAGAQQEIFTIGAMDCIYEASCGTPRLINVLADTALVYGFSDDQEVIDEKIVLAVLRDKTKHGTLSINSNVLQLPRSVSNA